MFNKFPFYRILVLFTLFSMSLTACNAVPTATLPARGTETQPPAVEMTGTPLVNEVLTSTPPEPTRVVFTDEPILIFFKRFSLNDIRAPFHLSVSIVSILTQREI